MKNKFPKKSNHYIDDLYKKLEQFSSQNLMINNIFVYQFVFLTYLLFKFEVNLFVLKHMNLS